MTKEFDPTRPCRYRCGEKPLAVFALPEPQEDGETIVSVRRSLRAHTHFPDGRLALDARSGLDLINISEEVVVERWGLICKDLGVYHSSVDSEASAEKYKEHFHVVRMTGVYTR